MWWEISDTLQLRQPGTLNGESREEANDGVRPSRTFEVLRFHSHEEHATLSMPQILGSSRSPSQRSELVQKTRRVKRTQHSVH